MEMFIRKNLSDREREVAILIARGKANKEIACELNVSLRRISEVISIIKEKWNVESRVQVGILAYRMKFIEIQSETEKLL